MKKNSIVFFLSQSMFLGLGITDILNTSNTDSIISILIGSILSLVLFFFINRISNHKSIIGVIMVSFYFMYTLFSLNSYTQNIYLNKTPSLLILILFLLPILYLVSKDYNVIIKVSFILFIITIINTLISYINLFPLIDIDNYKPIFNASISNIFTGSLKYMFYFTIPTFLIVNVPNKNNYLFFVISHIGLLLSFILIIGIYGIDLSKIFYYPKFILLKKINYFNFIEHIENILTFNWLFSLFMTSVMSLKYIKEYINNKMFYILVIILTIFSTKLFRSNISGYDFMKNNFIFICIPILIIILFNNLRIKKK